MSAWHLSLLMTCCLTSSLLSGGVQAAEVVELISQDRSESSVSAELTRQLLTARAAEAAFQRKSRLAARHQAGRSVSRPAIYPEQTLLNDPAIYRIDYGIKKENAAVPFLMYEGLRPRQ